MTPEAAASFHGHSAKRFALNVAQHSVAFTAVEAHEVGSKPSQVSVEVHNLLSQRIASSDGVSKALPARARRRPGTSAQVKRHEGMGPLSSLLETSRSCSAGSMHTSSGSGPARPLLGSSSLTTTHVA